MAPHSICAPMEPLGDLVEAIYASPLRAGGWQTAMRLLHTHFGSNMEAFYFLEFGAHQVQVIDVNGVAPGWLNQFGTLYFLPDNPWARLTGQLHQPGVVRTAERLIEFTGDAQALHRSTYFNEWMRPQHFAHTIGITPYADNGVVANISLFRPADMPIFGAREIADFEILCRHFRRALQFDLRLEQAMQAQHANLHALDASADGYAMVDAAGRLQHANARMEQLLRVGTLLMLRGGRLQARDAQADRRLSALIAEAARATAPCSLELAGAGAGAGAGGESLSVKAMPVPRTAARYLPPRAAVLLMVSAARRRSGLQQARERYRLTPAEWRLAAQLADGCSLRGAAERCGIAYGTARGYLKLLFSKTGTHRQSELVALLLAEPPAPPAARTARR